MDSAYRYRREQLDSSMNEELADTSEMLIDRVHQLQSGGDDGQSQSIFRINQMPPEIIAYMFEFYVYNTWEYTSSWTHSQGAFLLGSVCQLWRQIAWTTPTLWTELEFLLGTNTTERQIQLAIEWLSRSGKLPLSINLILDDYEKESLGLPLIDVIDQSMSRCRDLGLERFTSLTFSRFSRIQGPSNLRTLRLEAEAEDITSPLVLGSEAAPTHLDITGIRLNLLVVNWNNLTHFYASGLYVHDILQALNLAPQLTRCCQSDIQSTLSMPPNGYNKLIHFQVKDLSLDGEHTEGAVATFFQNSTFPNLGQLEMSYQITFPTTAFLDFLSRSSCPIEKLTIYETIIASQDLIDIAKALPSITFLSINHIDANEQPPLDLFYNALCRDPKYANRIIVSDDDFFLPSLQQFRVRTSNPFPWAWLPGICYQYHYDNGIYTTSLGRCLKEIYIDVISDPDNNVVEDEGLDMSRQQFSPADLIDSWQTYSELIELSQFVKLDLKIASTQWAGEDLFLHSYRMLNRWP